MEQFFSYFERLLIVLSPIIAAYFAYKSAVTEKETKKYVELRQKYEKEVEEKREEAQKRQDEAIAKMQNDLQELRKDMDEWRKVIKVEDINGKLDTLLSVSRLNFEYSQSLSSVILAIGDIVERADVGDVEEIRKEVNRHRDEEKDISSALLKLIH